jgi:O-antigen ligase
MAQPLGQGIGSFARIEPGFTYPHNVILEAAYELGALGLGVMVWMYAVVAHRAWQLWRSPPHRIFGAVLALVFLHMLKAGDLSTLAFQWVALYLLLVGTPLDERWALQKGDA